MTPGATAVTRIPNRDSSGPRLRTNPETPYLEAMYYRRINPAIPLSVLEEGNYKWSQRIGKLASNAAHMQNIALLFLLQKMRDRKLRRADRVREVDVQQFVPVPVHSIPRFQTPRRMPEIGPFLPDRQFSGPFVHRRKRPTGS